MKSADLDRLAERCQEGKLTPVIDREFPFAEVNEAFAHLEQGRAKGKVVVTMNDGK